MDKRTFLRNVGLMGLAAPLNFVHIEAAIADVEQLSLADIAKDEDFWLKVRGHYELKPDYINLENGYYCFMPKHTMDRLIEHMRSVNYEGSYYMRTVQNENKRKVADKVAEIVGCTGEEVAITRNTTESLDLIIGGKHWNTGDEAVMAEQDYGAMLDHFKFVERRFGVVNRLVSVPNHPKDDQEIVDLYASAITDKTRLLMVCHMVNITGQILPVRKIADMAHARGVEVMVDGAHAFSHIDFNMKDLDCDYYGTSLHKWLSAPLGSGMLYVKKEKIDGIWPLLAERDLEPGDMRRLNHIGTHPVHTDLAILDAIDYQNAIGLPRKEARLKFLQHYWTSQVRDLPRVIVNTPAQMSRHGGIGNVGIDGIEPADLAKTLMDKFGIFTVAIDRPGVKGLRITPNIYTTTEELDIFVNAIRKLSS
ncbi:MAG: aminotransferase class V-fold PLP-dependent enzyme [Proteobacteria bacterium]|nr:aminotransferase class V-fold PLP-dependent enzyme [Pseudomonadota bacterium]MDA0995150.1 aminotransferase class V-fold PLP-dependent enzyme [Pseudomonadota bacterium]